MVTVIVWFNSAADIEGLFNVPGPPLVEALWPANNNDDGGADIGANNACDLRVNEDLWLEASFLSPRLTDVVGLSDTPFPTLAEAPDENDISTTAAIRIPIETRLTMENLRLERDELAVTGCITFSWDKTEALELTSKPRVRVQKI